MNFRELKLRSWILNAIDAHHYKELTSIQTEALPFALNHKSLIITSQTGSGKTLCYLIPILQDIDFIQKKTQAVIILPTKELARQVYSRFLDFKSHQKDLRCILLIGNMDVNQQIKSIRSNQPQIVIGTVTRVLDLMKNGVINKDINTLVLDEVDMLLDMGFHQQVNQIFDLVRTKELQKIACSATTHYSLANQLRKYFQNTKVITVGKSIWSNPSLTHYIVYNSNNDPQITLFGLMKSINPYFCIIFANTKNIANMLYEQLLNRNVNVGLLHKDLTTRQRKNIYKDLQDNRYQYLVATDLASRGLDIEGADIVISYDLPDDDIWYIHRVGRVGRAGALGKAYTIYQNGADGKIMRLSKKQVNWNYLFLNKENELVNKPLTLKFKPKLYLDEATNSEIKRIIGAQSKHIKPGYKKKIKAQIYKIKQRKRHEFIEKKIKQRLIQQNIYDTKKKKH